MPALDAGVTLHAAVLPASRSVAVGTPATAFATIVNGGTVTARGCKLALASTAYGDFSFASTDSETNLVEGMADFPAAEIAPNASQSFVFAITPAAAFEPTEVGLEFRCANAQPAPVAVGLNTLLLSASATPTPDIVALAATAPNNDGIVTVPGPGASAAFAVATVNVGVGADITMTADTGSGTPALTLTWCEIDPTLGQCVNPSAPTGNPITVNIDANATPAFGVFVTALDEIPFDPISNRVFVRFADATGASRGATSVAVRTL